MYNGKKVQNKNNFIFQPIYDILSLIRFSFPNNFKDYILKKYENEKENFFIFNLSNDEKINNEIKNILLKGNYSINEDPIKSDSDSTFLQFVKLNLTVSFYDEIFFLEKTLMISMEIIYKKEEKEDVKIIINNIKINFRVICEYQNDQEQNKKFEYENLFNYEEKIENKKNDILFNEKENYPLIKCLKEQGKKLLDLIKPKKK